MKVLVIGATGLTGQHAIRLLLARGDDVTALARDPAAITTKHDRLRVAKGDARDAESLENATQGQDAVLAAFGPRSTKKDDLQETLMRNLLAAMKTNGVRRFVNLSALGAGDSDAYIPFIFRVFRALLLRHLFADKDRGELLLFASDVDWVNVRPGRLTNGAARGGVRASGSPAEWKQLKPWLTREDLAIFMVEQLATDTWVRKSFVVGY